MFSKTKIKKIYAREILDSRGNPTVEVEVVLKDESEGIAAVPSGASKGANEALEVRDNDPKRYGGKGMLKVCDHINRIISEIVQDRGALSQKELDKILIELNSGSENKSKLGANAILGVSTAFAKAMAKSQGLELFEYIQSIYESRIESNYAAYLSRIPIPMFNILNGGQHAANGVDIQEFMIVPIKYDADFSERLKIGAEIFHNLAKILKSRKLETGLGDEGGYAPRVSSHNEIFELLNEAGSKSGYKIKEDFKIAIDSAASFFYNSEKKNYFFHLENGDLSSKELLELYKFWQAKYGLFSVEDGLQEEDFDGWNFMKKYLYGMQIVADDLTVTNVERLNLAIKNDAANAIIIKPNQIGTLSETFECAKKAQKAGWKIIVSHRSGETCDDFIADLSVGIGAEFIKSGAPSRGERVAKYNRLLKISEICKENLKNR
ncbi:MAG: phosphopyruvate hydratase [bacterium]